MRLSVLDQSTIVTNRPAAESIRESIALAQACEGFGYHRYWVAEHHNSASQAGTAPEILIAAIAASTHRIRVGSAGVMLPHYSALKVAEHFRVLEAIAPGRIDMGLGRAPGSDGLTAHALNPNAATAADQFPAQVRDLLAWVGGEPLLERHPFRSITAQPAGPPLRSHGFSAAATMAPRSPHISACPIASRISSPTAPGRPRRWRPTAPASGRAHVSRSRSPPSPSGP